MWPPPHNIAHPAPGGNSGGSSGSAGGGGVEEPEPQFPEALRTWVLQLTYFLSFFPDKEDDLRPLRGLVSEGKAVRRQPSEDREDENASMGAQRRQSSRDTQGSDVDRLP